MRRRTLVLGALLGASGCTALPTSGPVRTQARRTQAQGPGEVAIDPNPPMPGASPDLIVQGFMLAMATYQPGYQAARQYLTEAARGTWQPEAGLLVYADGNAPRAVGDQVMLEAPLVGSLDPRGAYSAVVGATQLRHDFQLVKEKDEWRISNPPSGLLMSRYLFGTSYSQADVYFFEASRTWLVPDTRYLPRGNRVADAAVRALLAGPSEWLGPAVISVIPLGSHLAQEVVGSGTVTIALTGVGGPLPVPAGLLLAAQLAATLRQLPDVSGFRLTVDGGNVDLPDVRSDGSVPLTIADRFDPVGRLTTQLFGIAAGLLVRVGDGLGAVARPVTGDFGTRARSVSSIAISRDGVDAAVVTGDSLVHGPVDGPGSRVVVTAKGLLRPQFTAGGALWAITSGGTVYRVVGDIADVVPAPALAAIRVLAFRIAPDGQRIAFVADDKGRRVLGLVRVDREPAVRLSGWRTIPLARDGSPVGGLLDVGWTSPSSLVVLASSGQAEQGVFELDVDAVQVRETGRAERWEAPMLAASPRGGNAARTVVLADDGTAWQYVDAFRWGRLAEGLSAAAYPG